MLRKQHVYAIATVAWPVLVFGAAITAYSGQAEPYVSASQMPGGPTGMFGGALGVSAVGWAAIGTLRKRSWLSMGRRAGLAPEGGSVLPIGQPDMTGSVHGRTVRARTRSKTTGGGGESGSSKSTFTVVEADLPGPSDRGLFVGRGDSAGGLGDDVGARHLPTVTIDDEFVVVGDSEELARAVLTDRVRDALRAMEDDDDGLLVGDAGGVVSDAVSGASDSRLVQAAANRAGEKFAGDAATVSHETRGLLLDADELERRLEAVAAAADAFEDATAG